MKTKLKIHKWPEKILRRKAKKVEKVDEVVENILDQMYLLMKSSDGVGLAANQAGVGMQLVVIEFGGQVFKLVNPEIVERKGSMVVKEGCLSFPGIELDIKRNNKIKVKALDQKGNPLSLSLDDALAVVFQHEIDHINGVVFIDRISLLQRLKIVSKLKKIKKQK